MSLAQMVLNQAVPLAGQLDDVQQSLLKALCHAQVHALTQRLKEGMRPEDCEESFVMAAAMLAAAALREIEEPEQFSAGDLTVYRRSGADAQVLRRHAEQLMIPHVKDRVVFQGV